MNTGANKAVIILVGATAMLLLSMSAIMLLSPQFAYGGDTQARPTIPFVLFAIIAGLAWLVAVAMWMRVETGRAGIIAILAIGLLLRGILFASTPILEDDYYRYLWDGGVAAHGMNPYAHAPADAHSVTPQPNAPTSLKTLARESGHVHPRVNHRHLGTVYPPTAQLMFAIAHVIQPWSLFALRGVLFLCDAAALGFLLLLLRRLDQPLVYAAIYWWNPLLIQSTYSNAHMDVIVLPFLLAAVWLVLRRRPFGTGIAAGLAIGAKLWPVILAPILLKRLGLRRRERRWAAAGCALILIPMAFYLAPALELGDRSGFFAYSDEWEMNDALFMAVHKAAETATHFVAPNASDLIVGRLARALTAALLLLVISWLVYPPLRDDRDLLRRCMWVVAALFLLSPTQFPWYYLWLLPFLALSPQPALMALTVMLPIYYLKFWYAAHDDVRFFHNVVVWLEYAPVFVLLAWGWRAQRRTAPQMATAS